MILKQGQIVGNRWNVVYLIKENPYAESYRVEDEGGNPYFLKIYRLKDTPEKLIHDGEVTEVSACRLLQHKNIVSYVDHGVYSDEAGDCRYLVATYFSGELLSELIQRKGKLPKKTAVKIFVEMLQGLRYLHKSPGVLLHNDINPTNVMLSSKTGGVAELIDMGHISPCFMGTPPFDTADLDPRYASGQSFLGKYDERNDIFAATGVFYTMLTGKTPWDIEFTPGMTRKEKIKLVQKVRSAQGEIDVDDIKDKKLQAVVACGLSLSYTDRYESVNELMGDLIYGDNSEMAQEIRSSIEADEQDDDDNAQEGWIGGSNSSSADRAEDEAATETRADVEIKRGGGNGFADIAGMDDLKEMLRKRVILILKDKELAEKYRLTPPNGMLLYGPPGCGKSFFAEKFAEETGFNFIMVKASDLGSIYIHGSQGKIADLFKKAEENAPSVLCFDEFDAFVPTRSGDNMGSNQAGEVNEFLSQLNNCSKRGIFVIATSNRPDKIDPAVLRTGRIDKQVYVPMPDHTARRLMFELYLKGRPCGTIDSNALADKADGYVASDIAYVVNEAATIAAFNHEDITQELLIKTIEGIKPSVGKDLLKEYEEMRDHMEGITRTNALPHVGFK
ncbi:MAG: AAA family ATPase [Muribaculaceae bacterium]|nr:AAA family ATPase [Muribaculaceae bacterium]